MPQVARLLGISERAVRRRIERQTIRAERTGAHWTVILEAVPEPVRGGITASSSGLGEHGGGTHAADALRDVIREQQERIVQLSQRIGELQTELARARAEAGTGESKRDDTPFPEQRAFWLWRILGRR